MKSVRRLLIPFVLTGLATVAGAQLPANKVRLLKQIPLSGFPGSPASGSGCAGYISPSGQEYAIMGLRNGNAVINITNATNPVIVGHIPGVSSQWHEVCVLGDYAYACTEGGGGIQIIDLRQVDQGIVTLAATYTLNGVSTGHTIQAVPGSKLIMINGGNMPLVNGQTINGLRALDCQNPTQPVEVGKWQGKYVHDTLYHTYTSGPYAGKTICFAFCGTGALGGMYIIDVTTTQNGLGQNVPAMTTLGFIRYFPNATNFYSHSGSISPDGRYIYANDEFDEGNALVTDCTTHIIDVQNLASPVYAGSFNNPINAIDHNSMVQDGYLFLSAYKSGLRIYDLSSPTQLRETGFIDTYPSGSGFQYQGAWGTWAGFPSGNVIISDINAGFFVVDPSEAKGMGAPITGIATTGFTNPGNADKLLRKQDQIPLAAEFSTPQASVTVTFTTSSTAKSKVDLLVVGKDRSDLGESIWIFAISNSGQEQLIGFFDAKSVYGGFKIAGLDGATYIDSENKIRLRLEMRKDQPGNAQFDIDLAQVFVHN